MKIWESLATGFRNWPGFGCKGPYEKRPLCSSHLSRIVARRGRHSDCDPISRGGPIMRDTNVIVSLELSRRRPEQIRTSSLAEHALDQCEEAFRRGDWQKFGYWHTVFLCERDRLESPNTALVDFKGRRSQNSSSLCQGQAGGGLKS